MNVTRVRYTVKLKEALSIGLKKGFVTGSGMGLIMFVMFATYSLAFWFLSFRYYSSAVHSDNPRLNLSSSPADGSARTYIYTLACPFYAPILCQTQHITDRPNGWSVCPCPRPPMSSPFSLSKLLARTPLSATFASSTPARHPEYEPLVQKDPQSQSDLAKCELRIEGMTCGACVEVCLTFNPSSSFFVDYVYRASRECYVVRKASILSRLPCSPNVVLLNLIPRNGLRKRSCLCQF